MDGCFGRRPLCRPLAPFAHHSLRAGCGRSRRRPVQTPGSAWNGIARSVAPTARALLRARQVTAGPYSRHREGEPIGQPADADILVTNDPQVAAAIQTADCVPVLIADTRTGAVAAAHAGWRGLAQRVPLAAVEAMVKEFGTRESKLIAAIGPAIGACCYEVGGEVRDRFAAAGFGDWEMSRWFRREAAVIADQSFDVRPAFPRAGGSLVSRRVVSRRDQLRAAGVREDDLRRRVVHGQPSRRVLLVPARWIVGGTDGRRHQKVGPEQLALTFRLFTSAKRRVHRLVGEPIGVGIERAADALEGDAADLVRDQRGLCAYSGCNPGCLTLKSPRIC